MAVLSDCPQASTDPASQATRTNRMRGFTDAKSDTGNEIRVPIYNTFPSPGDAQDGPACRP
jgi:hypothetical protein